MKTRQVRAMRKRPIKCYISLNEAFEINEAIKDIFDNVTLFSEKGFTSNKLFKLLMYEAGDRLMNYKFPMTSSGIQVTQDNIEDIQTYVDLFTDKFRYKYLALIESEDFEYDPLDNTDITENKDGTRTPNLTDTTSYNSMVRKAGSETIDYGKEIYSTDNTSHTLGYTKTDGGDSTRTINTTDETIYGRETYDDTTTTYGKTTEISGSDNNTHSVSPYDAVNNAFYGSDKDQATNSSTTEDSGSDTVQESIHNSGSDTLEKSGTIKDVTGNTEVMNSSSSDNRSVTTGYQGQDSSQTVGTDTHSGSDQLVKTGTETNEEEMTRKGFQPQYSISSRQDMVNKYRDVSNFSAVDVYIKEVANYIMLGVYKDLSFD